jgi:hypothetical protein
MEAFAHALELDESYFDYQGDAASPQVPGTPLYSHPNHLRIRKISALSDFAPINLKVKRFVILLHQLYLLLMLLI